VLTMEPRRLCVRDRIAGGDRERPTLAVITHQVENALA